MKIIHLCLSCFYIDGYSYQENQLISEHVGSGHDVQVLASTESFDNEGRLTYLQAGTYMGTDGAMVTRLPYRFNAISSFARKLRSYEGLMNCLERIKPEVIIFHGLCSWDLLTVAKYCRENTSVKFYADSHEDFNNSARSFLSKWGLHYFIYRPILRKCLSEIKFILCISTETMDFVHEMYGVSRDRLEYFPLGGQLFEDEEYLELRRSTREKMQWRDEDRVFLQSGKIDAAKRLDHTLEAFRHLDNPHAKLIIAGLLMPEVRDALEPQLKSDPRITYLGWVTPEHLRQLLCGADVYVQPGSQSATMQMALCSRRPVILDDVPSHRALVTDNGILVSSKDQLASAFSRLCAMPMDELQGMSDRSAEVAARWLDYRQQALRLLRPH